MPTKRPSSSALLPGFSDDPEDVDGAAVATIGEKKEHDHARLQNDRSRTAAGPSGPAQATGDIAAGVSPGLGEGDRAGRDQAAFNPHLHGPILSEMNVVARDYSLPMERTAPLVRHTRGSSQ